MQNNTYECVLSTIFNMADNKFAEFSSRIINGEKKLIGVKIPELRKIAKNLVRSKKSDDFLKECKFLYFEDSLIYGFIISTFGFDKFIVYLDKYLSQADSWGLIDSFVSSLSCVKKEKDRLFDFIKNRIDYSEGFKLRFFIVCILDYYVEENNLDFIFSISEKFKGKGYYVDMAISWLLSAVFVKFPDKTYAFLKSSRLDDFVFNKTLSKICDSYRVSDDDKIKIKQLKVEKNGRNTKNNRGV